MEGRREEGRKGGKGWRKGNGRGKERSEKVGRENPW